jgi:hypothetical protein
VNMTGFNPLIGGARRWDFLASLLSGLESPTFVEVGTKEGRTAGHVLKSVRDAVVIAIDPWVPMPQNREVERGESYEEWDFAKIEKDFWTNVGDHADRCFMWRNTSAEAAEMLTKPAELVFIDAAHDYANVKADIERWWPKVKDGGILAGHDFNHGWPTVERAVADSFPLMQVGVGPDSVWFVLKQPGVELRA